MAIFFGSYEGAQANHGKLSKFDIADIPLRHKGKDYSEEARQHTSRRRALDHSHTIQEARNHYRPGVLERARIHIGRGTEPGHRLKVVSRHYEGGQKAHEIQCLSFKSVCLDRGLVSDRQAELKSVAQVPNGSGSLCKQDYGDWHL
jgi:hypothetical protein